MKKLYYSVAVLVSSIGFAACSEVELCPVITIPATDTTPPIFTLSLKGPGIDQTLSTEEGWVEGFGVLLIGGTYDFVLSASDAGGTRLLNMQVPGSDIFTSNELRPDRAEFRTIDLLSAILELTNNDDAPTSCLIMSGSFTIGGDPTVGSRISCNAFDYGGTSGSSNNTRAIINLGLTTDVSAVGYNEP